MSLKSDLLKKIQERKAVVGVIGLGYVGLPLATAFAGSGFSVLGFDVDQAKVDAINTGKSYIVHFPSTAFEHFVREGRLTATADKLDLKKCDAIIICVPTPINKSREPDTTYIEKAAETIAYTLRRGTLISLESTTYPGTTQELLCPILERSGLTAGKDFFLTFSPEREDPGNEKFNIYTIPKVIGGYNDDSRDVGVALYQSVVNTVVPVSSAKTAEMVKILENTYRCVNIALVNELKMVCDRLDIDIWEVINAAKTKPFGFTAFYPGAGVGGHCIGPDPMYLSWKARQVDINTRFIDLASEINTGMPRYVVDRVVRALNTRNKSLKGSRVLVLGVAYKENIDDIRDSPALNVIDLLLDLGADVNYFDPFIPEIKETHKRKIKMSSLTEYLDNDFDCVLIITAHKCVDYAKIESTYELIVDTKNLLHGNGVIKA